MNRKSDTYSIKAGIFLFQMQELVEVSYLLLPSPKVSLRSPFAPKQTLEMTWSVVEWFLLSTWVSGGD